MIDDHSDLFPFACTNPNCRAVSDQDHFFEMVSRQGMAYAECEGTLYVGVTCEKCRWTSLKPHPRDQQIIDLREFIMMPDPDFNMEMAHQIIEDESRKTKNEFLHFQYYPAWDPKTVRLDVLKGCFAEPIDDVKKGVRFFPPTHDFPDEITLSFPYYIPSNAHLREMLNLESTSPLRQFRRLYPIKLLFSERSSRSLEESTV